MSPILVRPVREQLEHDRVIRLLQAKYKRKHEVAINIGLEQTTAVEVGHGQLFPDLVLFSPDKTRKLQGTIEVETGESVNSLESMAQWVPFSRLKTPFILYVPPPALEAARRLCAAHGADPAEIWVYHVNFDQVRFTLAHRSPNALAENGREAKGAKPAKGSGPKAAVPKATAKAKPVQSAKPASKPNGKPGGKPIGKPAAKAAAARTNGKATGKAKAAARPKAAAKAPPLVRKAAARKPAAKAAPAKSARRR